jgi:hypothetical protein
MHPINLAASSAPLVVCLALLSACGSSASGGGVPDANSDALQNVVKAVDRANPDNTWWKHVNRDIKGGFLADAKIYTNYKAESVVDMVEITNLCNAFLKEIRTDDALVVVYGSVTTKKKKIDGSLATSVDDVYKLAEGNRKGCDARPYYKSVEKALDEKGVSVEPFETKADSPSDVG